MLKTAEQIKDRCRRLRLALIAGGYPRPVSTQDAAKAFGRVEAQERSAKVEKPKRKKKGVKP